MRKLHFKLLLLTFSLYFLMQSAHATVYEWRDKQGNVHYSDTYQPNAKVFTITPTSQTSALMTSPLLTTNPVVSGLTDLNTLMPLKTSDSRVLDFKSTPNFMATSSSQVVTGTQPTAAVSTDPASSPPPVSSYTSLNIVSPDQDATIRDNQGIIEVQASITPELRSGDTLVLLLDGKKVAESKSSLTLSVIGIDRGEHRVEVQVVNSAGTVLQTSPSKRVFLHKAALGGAR